MHTMKRTVNGEFYGDPEHALGVRRVSEFKIESACYYLVEAPTTIDAALSSDLLGCAGVGRCEINGRMYTVLELNTAPETRQQLTDILTERELAIATLVALGQPSKQIADQLAISEWTVSTHLRRIFAKLGVHSRAAMVYRCVSLLGVEATGGA
jgi:DNA-binding CsgD family transcriptional regulator